MKKKNYDIKVGDKVLFRPIYKNSFGVVSYGEVTSRFMNTIFNVESINNMIKKNEIEILEIQKV